MKNYSPEIIETAAKKLEEACGFRIQPAFVNDKFVLVFEIEGNEIHFDVLFERVVNRSSVSALKAEINKMTTNVVLVTQFVNRELHKLFKQFDINYLDTTGNALITLPPLYVNITGNSLKRSHKNSSGRKPFYTAALRVVFTLLCNNGAENKTLREIAFLAGVTHGTVQMIIKDLIARGYLEKTNTELKLKRKEELLGIWVDLFPTLIKQKFFIGRFEGNIKIIDEIQKGIKPGLLGGETAGAMITHYLRPYIHTIYLDDKWGEFIFKNGLKRKQSGNFILMKKFWNFANTDIPYIVPTILVYADLIESGDPRNIETARIIYERDILRHFKEN